MTPQLQQAIRLLQLSTLDLQTEIQEALESNPLLEMEESSADSNDSSSDSDGESPVSDTSGDDYNEVLDFSKAQDYTTTGDAPSTQNADEISVDLEGKEMPTELPVDSDWDTLFDGAAGPSGSGNSEDDDYDFEGRNSSPESI